MRSHSTPSISSISTPSVRSQHFLIPPFERVSFLLLFVAASWFGSLALFLYVRRWAGLFLPFFLREDTPIGIFVFGAIAGVVLGASQWLVLRRYVPDWLWILATTTGYAVWLTTLQSWRRLLTQFLLDTSLPLQLGNLFPVVDVAFSTLLTAIGAIWLGLAQWLVLRRYSRMAWGWILVPSIALLMTGVWTGTNLLFNLFNIPFQMNVGLLNVGLFTTVQAIALCTLQKRNHRQAISVNRILATAPEIRSYSKVQKLANRLRMQLNQAWLSEPPRGRPLRYLVGVTERGTIAAYEPLHQTAINDRAQTPLAALTNASELGDGMAPLAHYQVSFLPSGRLEIIPWRGVPLLWVGSGMILAILSMSAIVGYLGGLR